MDPYIPSAGRLCSVFSISTLEFSKGLWKHFVGSVRLQPPGGGRWYCRERNGEERLYLEALLWDVGWGLNFRGPRREMVWCGKLGYDFLLEV